MSDETFSLSGSLDISVRFSIKDLPKLIEAFPKEWLALTPEKLKDRGGFAEWERLCVFLDDYLEVQVDMGGHGDQHTDIRVDWDDTNYPWSEERAVELDKALPNHLRFYDDGPEVDPNLLPGPNDVPLFDADGL